MSKNDEVYLFNILLDDGVHGQAKTRIEAIEMARKLAAQHQTHAFIRDKRKDSHIVESVAPDGSVRNSDPPAIRLPKS